MKKKELKNLAAKLAGYEKIIQTSDNKEEVRKAEEEIMKVTRKIESFEDLMELDELIMKLLEKN